jgi:hypothetical protein
MSRLVSALNTWILVVPFPAGGEEERQLRKRSLSKDRKSSETSARNRVMIDSDVNQWRSSPSSKREPRPRALGRGLGNPQCECQELLIRGLRFANPRAHQKFLREHFPRARLSFERALHFRTTPIAPVGDSFKAIDEENRRDLRY